MRLKEYNMSGSGVKLGTIRGVYKRKEKKAFTDMSLIEFLTAIKKTTAHPKSKEDLILWRAVLQSLINKLDKE